MLNFYIYRETERLYKEELHIFHVNALSLPILPHSCVSSLSLSPTHASYLSFWLNPLNLSLCSSWQFIFSNIKCYYTSWATREAQEYSVGSLSLLQGIFPTQELNWNLLHCRQILYRWATKETHLVLLRVYLFLDFNAYERGKFKADIST